MLPKAPNAAIEAVAMAYVKESWDDTVLENNKKRKRRKMLQNFYDAVKVGGNTLEAAHEVKARFSKAHTLELWCDEFKEGDQTGSVKQFRAPFSFLVFPSTKHKQKIVELSSQRIIKSLGKRVAVSQSLKQPAAVPKGTWSFIPVDVFDDATMTRYCGLTIGSLIFSDCKQIVKRLAKDPKIRDGQVLLTAALAADSRVTFKSLKEGFKLGHVKYAWMISGAKEYKHKYLTSSKRKGGAGGVAWASSVKRPKVNHLPS
jgi:hypothetical protein